MIEKADYDELCFEFDSVDKCLCITTLDGTHYYLEHFEVDQLATKLQAWLLEEG